MGLFADAGDGGFLLWQISAAGSKVCLRFGMKERDDQMLRDKLRKVWSILWLCLWILSCIGGLIEAMRIPAANAGKTGLDGATGFDLVILGFLLLSFQEWGLAVYLTGRYFLQKKEKKSPWKTVFYILLFVVAVILLPLSAINDLILLFELGVLFMPFVMGRIVWKILREKIKMRFGGLLTCENFSDTILAERGDDL